MTRESDWRLQGQEAYLKGVSLVWRRYRLYNKNPSWDHDHCEFCGSTFSLLDEPDHMNEGYSTLDDYRWICLSCFDDFKGLFLWNVVKADNKTEQSFQGGRV